MTTPQTTSLELSRKLKALGVPQESCFYWTGDEENHVKFSISNYDTSETMDCYSAYLSDEIGRMLVWLIENGYIDVKSLTPKQEDENER